VVCRSLATNEKGLLQFGDLKSVCPQPLLGFVLLLKLRTFVWLYSSSRQLKQNRITKSRCLFRQAQIAANLMLAAVKVF
jgi:hypothetical protein